MTSLKLLAHDDPSKEESSFVFLAETSLVQAREATLGAVICGREINKRDVTLTLPSRARLVLILSIFLGQSRESYG